MTHRAYTERSAMARGRPLLTLSLSIPLRLYTLPYWSNPLFLIFDIRALWRSGLSARAPECQKLKIVGHTGMALNPLNSSNLEQLALKGLIISILDMLYYVRRCHVLRGIIMECIIYTVCLKKGSG